MLDAEERIAFDDSFSVSNYVNCYCEGFLQHPSKDDYPGPTYDHFCKYWHAFADGFVSAIGRS